MHVLTIALALGYCLGLILLCLCPNRCLRPDYCPIALASCYALVLSLRPGPVHLHLPLPLAVELATDYRPRRVLALSIACCFACVLAIALVLDYCPGLLLGSCCAHSR